jgi:NAD(P)-dependent dehydrogenase (short-subunit alcohol dehydrogenase family)
MKTALITGFNRGIGKVTAEKFLNAGWRVIGICRNTEDAFQHENLTAIPFDLSNVEAIADLVSQIDSLDVLINNAGIINGTRDEKLSINLISPVELAIQLGEKMNTGRIVNLASIAGYIGHSDLWYGVTKAGLINATKSLAQRFKGKIIVNAVAPGPVDTDMIKEIPEERITNIVSKTAHKRVAKPEEVADTVFWLATESTEYVNGTCIHISDGAR